MTVDNAVYCLSISLFVPKISALSAQI